MYTNQTYIIAKLQDISDNEYIVTDSIILKRPFIRYKKIFRDIHVTLIRLGCVSKYKRLTLISSTFTSHATAQNEKRE